MGEIDILTQNLVETIVKGHSYYEMITGMGGTVLYVYRTVTANIGDE